MRRSLNYVSWKQRKQVAADLRLIRGPYREMGSQLSEEDQPDLAVAPDSSNAVLIYFEDLLQ